MPYNDRDVQIVDVDAGEVEHVLSSDGQRLSSLAWSPNGEFLAAGDVDRTVRLWDPRSGAEVTRMGNRTLNGQIKSISWRPDNSQLACATSDTGVVVWRLGDDSGWSYLLGHTTYVHSVAWSPDGARIASADESGSVRIWDAQSEQMTLELHYAGGVSELAWSPDGKSLAAVGYGGEESVRIWSTEVDPRPAALW
jgi:WD40 repeat protein